VTVIKLNGASIFFYYYFRILLWKRTSLFIWAPWENLRGGGDLFTGVFERRTKEGSGRGASLHGSDVRVTRREGSYNQDSERHDMEVSANGVFLLL
jgi:hypothetical protein